MIAGKVEAARMQLIRRYLSEAVAKKLPLIPITYFLNDRIRMRSGEMFDVEMVLSLLNQHGHQSYATWLESKTQ